MSCRQSSPYPSSYRNITRVARRWEKHAHDQALCVEAALSKVRLMQNDMSNLSLDALVTLKHELSGGGSCFGWYCGFM